ncbi:MAG: uncharacterized membrane protein YgdD (TMEM256/DUF423 family) [Glaciecola sp.]|jgi:uncharacterized membrane protein YgdD (TMEM256/DUF423 family)
MNKKILIVGSVFGLISIVLGAFASHGLENLITKDAIETFQVGVRYQMYHALLLLFVGSTLNINPKSKQWIFRLTLVGVVLFSGSIYGLATNTLTGFDFKTIGFVTPIGGLLFIVSWAIMLLDFLKLKDE